MKAFLVARQLVAKRNYEFHSSQAIHVIPLHESGVEKRKKVGNSTVKETREKRVEIRKEIRQTDSCF